MQNEAPTSTSGGGSHYLEKKYGKDIIFGFEFDEKNNALIWKVKRKYGK